LHRPRLRTIFLQDAGSLWRKIRKEELGEKPACGFRFVVTGSALNSGAELVKF